MLHGGPTKDHPIIAAAGDERVSSSKYITHGPNSDIILLQDPLNPRNSNVTSSVMRAKISESGKVAFTFHFITGDGPSARTQQFSWISIKREEPGFRYGGFRLVRHALDAHVSSSGNYLAPPQYHSSAYSDGDTLARLIYSKPFEMSLSREMFILEFTDQAASIHLGGHWTHAAVMSALRLYHLGTSGRTSQMGIEFAGSVRGLQL
ncbi:hypothetical protein ONZ43_g3496 [Nemania bipapillata]|uniref:Uncharacterized protein n=1 Tax=Nemania bipapillata TaxID=110536 RepID=A0ACC2IWU5_9PEZI|nr:hypothetical protein ONZ43_g3496 [Nemania bipapillata]